jgi:hypothetical protein
MHHIEILKKEIITAKRILKSPNLRDKVIKDTNFDRIVYEDDEKVIEHKPEKKLEPAFNPLLIKIYPVASSKNRNLNI